MALSWSIYLENKYPGLKMKDLGILIIPSGCFGKSLRFCRTRNDKHYLAQMKYSGKRGSGILGTIDSFMRIMRYVLENVDVIL